MAIRLRRNRSVRLRRNRSAPGTSKRASLKKSLLSLVSPIRQRRSKKTGEVRQVGGKSLLTTGKGKPSFTRALSYIISLRNKLERAKNRLKRSRRPAYSGGPVHESGTYQVYFYLGKAGNPLSAPGQMPLNLGPFLTVRAAAAEAKTALRQLLGRGVKISEITVPDWDTMKPPSSKRLKANPRRPRGPHATYDAVRRSDGKVMNYLHPSLYQGQADNKPVLQAMIFKIGDRSDILGEYKYNPRRPRAVKCLMVRNPLVKFASHGKVKEFMASYTGKDKGTYAVRKRKKLVRKGLRALKRRGLRDTVSATTFRLYTRVAGQTLPRLARVVKRTSPITVAGLRKALKLGKGIIVYPVDASLPAGYSLRTSRRFDWTGGGRKTKFRLSAPRKKAVRTGVRKKKAAPISDAEFWARAEAKTNPRRKKVRRRKNSAYRLNRRKRN